MTPNGWDFEYAPISSPLNADEERGCDLILASEAEIDPVRVSEALCGELADLDVGPILSRHPLYWTRIRSTQPAQAGELEARLRAAGIVVRYLASARQSSQCVAPALDFGQAQPAKPYRWRTPAPRAHSEPTSAGHWFLRKTGVDVVRADCGTGAGTRLGVIDHGIGATEDLGLDAVRMVGGSAMLDASWHGALMAAWAIGTRHLRSADECFVGVAPDASARLYCIPKPGKDVLCFPLAIVQAVDDGADAVVCATYVDGTTSPMLDDALEFAVRAGRGGRGTPVVLPTSREISSPPFSASFSLSLGFGEPASDPRVFCIGPSSKDGGWFLWRDRKGLLHPFANRGPAVRWLAPGDDVAHPFVSGKWSHAESSGAAAIAAGVILLVLEANPELTVTELGQVLTATASSVAPTTETGALPLGNKRDVQPTSMDPDGHNAKHGYGRLNARRACLTVSDPFAASLVMIGETDAASAYRRLLTQDRALRSAYSERLARWGCRAMLADAAVSHAARAVARHLRLVGGKWLRHQAQTPGSTLRQVTVLLRALQGSGCVHDAPPSVIEELAALADILCSATRGQSACDKWERGFFAWATALWTGQPEADHKPVGKAMGEALIEAQKA